MSAEIPDDRAVVDRIVDGRHAVLLRGADGDELTFPASALPDGVREGTWLIVSATQDGWRIIDVDAELTTRRRNDARRRVDELRGRRSGGRFDR